MEILFIHKIVLIITEFLVVFLGAWVFSANKKARENQAFLVMSVAISLWLFFYYNLSASTGGLTTIIWPKLGYLCVALFFAFFYLFFANYLKLKIGTIGKLVVAWWFLNGMISVSTDLVVKDVIFENNSFKDLVLGSWAIVYYLSAFITFFFVLFVLFKKYYKSSSAEKMKYQYFLIGVFIWVIMNLIFNVGAMLYLHTIKYAAIGNFSVIFFLTFTAIAIVRHKLMDIRTAVARSVGFLFLLVSVAGLAGLLMMLLPVLIFSQETLDNPTLNILIRSSLGIVLVFSFQPLKIWITKITDRIFFKNEYDFHELIKRITDTSHSTLMLIELLYKMVDLLIKEMKVSKGHFVLLDDGGTIHTTQAIGFQSSPDIKAADVKGLATHGILVLENLEDSSHFKKLLKKTDAAVSVGLMDETGPIGALLLGEKNSGDMYSAKDIRVLGILSTSISVAIQRAKEHEKVQNFNVYLQTEIARKTKELQEANEHLRELDKAKDEFISMASHQLRTPLTAIKGYLSMLLEGDAGEIKMAQFDFINEAFDGANRMVALINDLLNVSRMDTGRFFLEPVEIDLTNMVKQEVKQLEQAAKEKRLYFEFKTKNKALKVKADETKIRQVIMNFIDNAVYYTPSGGITITLDNDSKNAIFKVTDTGMGVPESEKERLFQKFFRANNARKSRPDGTGLGIYLAKKVIEDHGGEIIFESKEGKGSTFGFKLPIKSRIKKDITVPPADLATKAPAIGSGEEVHGDPDVGSVIFVSDKK